MEQVSFVRYHQIDKSILKSVVCKLHIDDDGFVFRVNVVDLPVSCFSKPLMVVCHQLGMFDLFIPLCGYNEEIVGTFISQVKEKFDFYMSKKDEIWWHYDHNKDIDDFVTYSGRDRLYYCISEELSLKIWSKRYIRKIICNDIKREDFQLYKSIIHFVCFILKSDDGLLFDILFDTYVAGEEYLIKLIHEVFGIQKRKLKHLFGNEFHSTGFERKLTINKHSYYINLLYKRFGSFQPVTVSFRKHYNKTNLYFESYYTHKNCDEIVRRIKNIDESITQWNALITQSELQEFVETYCDNKFASEPAILCQLLARKYLDASHIEDDMFESKYLSLCLLINDVLSVQTKHKLK